ncbi:MAG TPA: hypothetical protein VEB20_10360 [Azospirillaceae bacterium]|nr:hypothetical protein [Azospirillaceae bacterium]
MPLKWKFKEHAWGETADYEAAGLKVRVVDADGDWSRWSITRGEETLAEGKVEGHEPYHFDAALAAAENALGALTAPSL